jgi:hypothetical protein
MSYAEDILKLRGRIAEAISTGALDESKDTLEAILIQVMNDSERNRQNTVSQAENLRKQAATLDGQAAAFSSMVSIVYNVINGFIRISERAKEKDDTEDHKQAQIAQSALEEDVKVLDIMDEKDSKKTTKQSKKKA